MELPSDLATLPRAYISCTRIHLANGHLESAIQSEGVRMIRNLGQWMCQVTNKANKMVAMTKTMALNDAAGNTC